MPPPHKGRRHLCARRGTTLIHLSYYRQTFIAPLTREYGSFYGSNPEIPEIAAIGFQRNGSEASSLSALTGSHQPPALWKARNNYYSSSMPLVLCCDHKKNSRPKSSCFIFQVIFIIFTNSRSQVTLPGRLFLPRDSGPALWRHRKEPLHRFQAHRLDGQWKAPWRRSVPPA